MSGATHTPGDWHVEPRVQSRTEGGRHAFVEVVSDKSIFWLARVQTFDNDKGEYAANARLMAAGSAMLAALKLAEAFIADELESRKRSFLPDASEEENGLIGAAQTALDAASAAIRKAEGR